VPDYEGREQASVVAPQSQAAQRSAQGHGAASDMSFAHQVRCEADGGNPEDAALIARMAADILGGGTWWRTQAMPDSYSGPLLMLDEAMGLGNGAHGDHRIQLFDSAICALGPAFDGVDGTWVAAQITPRVVRLSAEFEQEAAKLQIADTVSALNGGEESNAATASALEMRLGEIEGGFANVGTFFNARTALLGQRVAQKFDWESVVGGSAIIDPVSKEPVPIGAGGDVVDVVRRLKSGLRLVAALSSGSEMNLAESGAGQVSDVAELLRLCLEGTTSLIGVMFEGMGFACELLGRFVGNSDDALQFASSAADMRGLAKSIAASQTLSGALAALDLIRHATTLADPDASSDDLWDAGVGVVVSIANLGAAGAEATLRGSAGKAGELVMGGLGRSTVAAASGVCTVAAVAIPVTWLVFKASLRGMHDLKMGYAQGQLLEDFEALISVGNGRASDFMGITVAQALLQSETNPERQHSLEGEVTRRTLALSAKLAALGAGSVSDVPVLNRELRTATRHPGASGSCSDPAVVAEAVAQLNQQISWCLENVEGLVAEHLGLRGSGGLSPIPLLAGDECDPED
jgi:hypothetical protein